MKRVDYSVRPRAVTVPWTALSQHENSKAPVRKPVAVVGLAVWTALSRKLLSTMGACMSAAAVGQPDSIDCSNVHGPSLVTGEVEDLQRAPGCCGRYSCAIDRSLEDHAVAH